MKRKWVRGDGMYITIDTKDQGKESILTLHNSAGRMVHLQFVKELDEEIEKIRKEGFEERDAI